ncbi:hypothetical protein ACFLWE_01575, partial [Chloroflexota bacterium]
MAGVNYHSSDTSITASRFLGPRSTVPPGNNKSPIPIELSYSGGPDNRGYKYTQEGSFPNVAGSTHSRHNGNDKDKEKKKSLDKNQEKNTEKGKNKGDKRDDEKSKDKNNGKEKIKTNEKKNLKEAAKNKDKDTGKG